MKNSLFFLPICLISFFSLLLTAQSDQLTIEPAAHIGGNLTSSTFGPDYGYLAQGGYLTVLDLSTNPFTQIAYVDIEDKPTDMAIIDHFLITIDIGLNVYDLSDPVNPEFVTNLDFETGLEPQLFISGSLLFTAIHDRGVQIIDVTDPSNPILKGHFQTGNNLTDVFVQNNYAYVLDNTLNQLLILDVTDPDNPGLAGQCNVVSGPTSLYAENDIVYVTVNSYPNIGMRIYDASDKSDPQEIGYIETKTVDGNTTHYDSPSKIIVDQSRAYLACYAENSLYVIDVSDPMIPVEFSRLALNPAFEGRPVSFQKNETDFYLSYAWSGETVRKLDFSNPENLVVTNSFHSPNDALWIQSSQEYLYLSDLHRLWIYDMSDVYHPSLMASYREFNFLTRIFEDTNILYGARRDSLFVLDVSDPNQVNLLQTVKLGGAISELFIRNGLLFTLIYKNPCEIRIFDVSDPASPAAIATFPLSGIGHGLYFDESTQILAAGMFKKPLEYGFELFDLSDPGNPVAYPWFQTFSIPVTISINDHFLYFAGNTDVAGSDQWHIEVYDISDPTNPMLTDHFSRNGEIWDMEIENGILFAGVPGNTIFGLPLLGLLQILVECPSETTRQISTSTPNMTTYTGYAGSVDGQGYNYPTGYLDISGIVGVPIQIIKWPVPTPCCLKTAVRPEIAGNSGEPYDCTTTPICVSGECGSNEQVKASPGPEWVFTHWSGAAGGSSQTTEAQITGQIGCPPCSDNVAYAHFTPWLKTSGVTSLWECPFESEEEIVASVFTIEASKADSWTINGVDVKISGDSDLSQYIKKARLKWTGEEEKEHSGNGTISFNTSGLSLEPGKSQEFTLYLTFKEMTQLKCPGEPKEIKIEVEASAIDANALAYSPGKVLGMASGTFSVTCVRNITKNTNYEMIQEAVADASIQQEIWVCPGDYEENVSVDKEKLRIYAPEGPTKTYVFAQDKDKAAFQLKANHITVEGFGTREASNSFGIYIYGSTIEGSKLINNRSTKNKHGIYLQDAKKTTITNCSSFENSESGLHAINSTETTVSGSSFYQNKQNGVYFENCLESEQAHSTISNSSLRENNLNGVYLKNCKFLGVEQNIAINNNDSTGVYIENCEHVSVTNTPFIKENKNGIKIINSKSSRIVNNTIEENTHKGIYVLDCNPNNTTDANQISGNVIVGNRLSSKQKHGIYLNNSYYTNIGNASGINEIRSHELNGITIIGGGKNRLEGDSIFMNDAHGIYIENSCDNTITGKNKIGPENGKGILLKNCGCENDNGNTISLARVMDNKSIGIELTSSCGNQIGTDAAGNTLSGNKGSGVELTLCDCSVYYKNRIEDNQVYENDHYGIKLTESVNNVLIKNKIWSNKWNGIHLRQDSYQNTIEENTIDGKNKQEHGIYLDLSNGNLIDNNTIKSHKENGITINECTDGAYLINNTLEQNKNGIFCENSSKVNIGINDELAGPNHLISNKENGIYLKDCDGLQSMTIANNDIKNQKIGLLIENSRDLVIANNEFKGKNEIGIKTWNCDTKLDNKPVKIENNIITECLGHGILIENARGILVGGDLISKSNQIKQNKGNGISLIDSKPSFSINGYINRISNNAIHGENNNGVYLNNSQFNEIIENDIHDNNKDGIHLNSSLWNTLRSNSIRENKGNGIGLKQSEQNKIGANEMLRNGESGLFLTKSNFNEIPLFQIGQNLINENEDHGIRLDDCYGNKLRANEVKRNKKHGIVVNQGAQNKFFGPMEIMDNIKDGIQFSKTENNTIWNRVKTAGKKLEYAIQIKSNGSQGLHLKSSNNNSFSCLKIWRHSTGILLEQSNNNNFDLGVRVLLNGIGGHGICSYTSTYGLCTYSHNTITTLIDGCSVVPAFYEGCHFLESTENAFTLTNGGKPTLRQCNFIGIGDMAIENQSDTVVIDARFNWWGDPSGPGGKGPGSGGKISEQVLYDPWLTAPVALQAAFLRDTIYLQENRQDSIHYLVQNVLYPGDSVRIRLSDSLNWSGINSSYETILADTIGFDSLLFLTYDPLEFSGEMNKLVLESESLVYPDQVGRDSVYLLVYEPRLSKILLFPDSLELTLGESWQFHPILLDQHQHPLPIELKWWSDANGLDSTGLFTASETGIWNIWVCDIEQQDTAHVQVFVLSFPELYGITVDPPMAELHQGDSLQFDADGWDQYGNPYYFRPFWHSEGGIIDSLGLYQASELGNFSITAFNKDSTIWGEAEVMVILVNTGEINSAATPVILHQNYPNPFVDYTRLAFEVGETSVLKFTIYDALGNRHFTINWQRYLPGSYEIRLNTTEFRPGVYYYELETDGRKQTRKMIKIQDD